MLKIGQNIPDLQFEVFQNEKIKKYKFSDFKGKWLLLLFYPADFTFVCPTELSEAQKYYLEFQENNCEVISFSTDSVYVHKAWHDTSKLIAEISYPMGADQNGKICSEFSTYIEDEGVSLRASFIINPEGIVKAIEMHDNSIGRSIAELLRKLQASIYVSEHHGEVCPASWKPGEKTLKSGLKLVGKI